MKKVMFVVIAFLWVSVLSASAGLRIGVKAGVNLANATFNTEAINPKNFKGYQLGPVIELSSIGGLGVEGAVLFSQRGFKVAKDAETQQDVIDIPLNLKCKINLLNFITGYLSAGPYGSFKMKSNKLSLEMADHVKRKFESKTFGAGINLGFGITFLSHLQVGINYQIGMTDDYKSYLVDELLSPETNKGRSKVWSITAALLF
jgi:hypothetical protein